MERFCIRTRHERKRGTVWELLLYPENPRRPVRVSDGRSLGSASAPTDKRRDELPSERF